MHALINLLSDLKKVNHREMDLKIQDPGFSFVLQEHRDAIKPLFVAIEMEI